MSDQLLELLKKTGQDLIIIAPCRYWPQTGQHTAMVAVTSKGHLLLAWMEGIGGLGGYFMKDIPARYITDLTIRYDLRSIYVTKLDGITVQIILGKGEFEDFYQALRNIIP